jgi:phosphate transport system substrate-binding protein
MNPGFLDIICFFVTINLYVSCHYLKHGETISKTAIALLIALLIGSIAPTMASEKVTVSGSTTVLPLAEACAETFNSQQNNYQATVTGGGTGAGITAIAEKRSEIAMASRDVTADERNKYGNNFKEFDIGLDGICIAVSRQIFDAGVRNLTKDQLKGIYGGEIKNWKEVGGPDVPIYAIAREQGSGTRDTFNDVIMGSAAAETPGVSTVALGSAEAKTAIAGSKNAIAYLGFSYIGGNIGIVALNGIMPSVQSIMDNSYELGRHLYFYTFGAPSPGAKAFIDFVQAPEGQSIAQDNGFIPINGTASVRPAASNANPSKAEEAGGQAPTQKTQPGFEGIFAIGSILAISCIAARRRV